jgi:hypothetical protein
MHEVLSEDAEGEIMKTAAKVKYAGISARVIRADGTVEELGMIASTRKSEKVGIFIRRIKWQILNLLKTAKKMLLTS